VNDPRRRSTRGEKHSAGISDRPALTLRRGRRLPAGEAKAASEATMDGLPKKITKNYFQPKSLEANQKILLTPASVISTPELYNLMKLV
jgi:hypothetical protein